jgi:hypothetical protein
VNPTSLSRGGFFVSGHSSFLIQPSFLWSPTNIIGVLLEGEKLANRREQDYFCAVVSEHVEIALKRKPSLSRESKTDLFVQCNQPECQYAGLNQYPCPLRLNLFAEEIEKRGKKAQDRRMGL